MQKKKCLLQHNCVRRKIINSPDVEMMGQPWDIAFGKDGMWAVADHSNHCVYIFVNLIE